MASTGPASEELATAIGRYVLGEISLSKAAETAGLSRWEFETRLQEAGFDALYGPRTDEQLSEEIDTARNLNE
jgi:predicted HTH domain antitoxin